MHVSLFTPHYPGRLLALTVLSLTLAASTQGQAPAALAASPAPPIAYDAVSIHKNDSGGGGGARSTQDGEYMTNMPLRNFVAGAYSVHPDRVSGLPGWVEAARYDINLKVAPEDVAAYRKLRGKQRDKMTQAVLADRLKLQAHVLPKEFPNYQLVIAKGGPKLHEARPGDTYDDGLQIDGKPIGGSGMMMGRGAFDGQQVTVDTLVDALRGAAGRPVVDKTGLPGKYDISLRWDATQQSSSENATSSEAGPSIFSALEEQLGLKLVPSKGFEDTLVVDHIEKPSEN